MSRLPRWGNLGLRTKLALLIEGILLVVGLVTGLLATARMQGTLEAELTKRGLAIAGDLAMFSVRPLLAGDLATLRRFVNHTMSQDHVRSVAVLDPEGTVVMHSDLARVGRRLDGPLDPQRAGVGDARLRRQPPGSRARTRGTASSSRSRRRARASARS